MNGFRPTTLKDVVALAKNVEEKVTLPEDIDNDGDALTAECNMDSYSQDQRQALSRLTEGMRDYFVDNEGKENRRSVNAAARHGLSVSVTEDEEDPYVTHISMELPNGARVNTTTGRI